MAQYTFKTTREEVEEERERLRVEYKTVSGVLVYDLHPAQVDYLAPGEETE